VELAVERTNLGRVLMDLGRYQEAEPFIREAAETLQKTMSEDYFERIGSEINLASMHTALGRPHLGEPLYRSALERFQRIVGRNHIATIRVESLLARSLHRMGRLEEAEALYHHAVVEQRKDAPKSQLAESLIGQGALLCDQGQPEQAEPLIREGLALNRELLPQGHWKIGVGEVELGVSLIQLGRVAEARTAVEEGTGKLSEYGIDDLWILERAARLRAQLDHHPQDGRPETRS
jgi:tetratricopeptide (TPR) repeat protein